MAKAILVLDRIYDKCSECPLHFYEWQKYTDSKGHRANSVDAFCCLHRSEPIYESVDPEAGRPDWCQLKELPEEKEIPFDDGWYQRGWNDCLNEITEDEDGY